jgi:hypothetical protein
MVVVGSTAVMSMIVLIIDRNGSFCSFCFGAVTYFGARMRVLVDISCIFLETALFETIYF